MNQLKNKKFSNSLTFCFSIFPFVLIFLALILQCSLVLAHVGVNHQHENVSFTPTSYIETIKPSSEQGSIHVIVRDEHNNPTPAFISIKYEKSWQYIVLEQQFLTNPRLSIQRSDRPQWKSKFPIHITGKTNINLPVGDYQILVGKGIEYAPQKLNFTINKNSTTRIELSLERHINMPEKGWWSGDTHVHAPRYNAKSDRELLWAAQAEDIHISSVLVMGDANSMHFPQYALGKKGTVNHKNNWLVPGQEEPRTSELGHTTLLNTKQLYRNTKDYYRYDLVFNQARKDGALTGIAHFFGDKFYSRNAGALLLAEGLVDFVELIDNSGIFKPDHYYDALNMGAKLALTAGSDYPWGAHIGDNRTYAFIGQGETLTPAKWYNAIKAGKTFITQGPLLTFLINNNTIGSELTVNAGEKLTIYAQAKGNTSTGVPKKLSLISMGNVIHQAEAEKPKNATLEFSLTLTAQQSGWYVIEAQAHNGAIAHSSPIYITVNNTKHTADSAALIALYQQNINRIQQLSEAEFVPTEQRENFIAWLNHITLVYEQKIKQLTTKQTIKEETLD